MKIINKLSLALAALTTLLVLTPNMALADTATNNALRCGANSAASGDCDKSPSGSLEGTVRNIVNILSVIVGVAAVIMIIVAGLRYVTSGGKEEGVKNAKNSILYAIIGLVIVALAQIIVQFVLHATNNTANDTNSSSTTGTSGTSGSRTGAGPGERPN